MLIKNFVHLLAACATGKPVLYRRRKRLALLFDVFGLQSEMALDDPQRLVLGYTQSMMGFLLFKPMPQTVGMIGLGGGSLLKFCHRYLAGATLVTAEIDPAVIALRQHFHIPPDSERVQVLCQDGAEFVQQQRGRFDVLLVDGFDRRGQPPQLCSQAFYDACRAALTPDGLLVVNLLEDETAVLERIGRAFDGAMLMVDAIGSSNKVVFAGRGDALAVPDAVLARRGSQLEESHPVPLAYTALNLLVQRRRQMWRQAS